MSTDQASVETELAKIQQALAAGSSLQAEVASLRLIESRPDCVPALAIVAQCAGLRADHARAAHFWQRACTVQPKDEMLLHNLVQALVAAGDWRGADAQLAAHWAVEHRLAPENWLVWGHIKQGLGEREMALRAWFRALHRARAQGRWINEATTPAALLPGVLSASRQLSSGRSELLHGVLDGVRREVGGGLDRIDRAVKNYLGQTSDGPSDPRQRPKFLYIPGLPDAPYHDPYLQPWAHELEASFDVLRAEALSVLADEGRFEAFLTFGPKANIKDYLGGEGEKPAWDAFFFYRHGKRYDANHGRCPGTSAVLERLDLCAIKGQAPEVCFSLLAPGSHIMPHYGVTNSRLVMHLPLVVPADCALNVIGAGEHHWQEGKLMMFDDTYQHEAWNRSGETRLILLMDCWNPHLTAEERVAVTRLVECISDFENVF
jgi:aspartate beta-hydroxylase